VRKEVIEEKNDNKTHRRERIDVEDQHGEVFLRWRWFSPSRNGKGDEKVARVV
jgi:hypothetical protein